MIGEAFRALDINPNKYLCSIEALFTRIAKGKGMPHINPVVDLGNAVSLKYTLPMGAHDLGGSSEDICIRFALPGDTFLPFGGEAEETPDSGEVVYAVGHQVRTRRWTWRQSEHGKITPESTDIFFPIDGFTDFNRGQVLAACQQIIIVHLVILFKIPQMPLSPYANWSAFRLILSGNQIVVPDKLILQACPFVCDELLHCVFLQIKFFTSKSIPLSLNKVF